MAGEVGADISYFQSFDAAEYTLPFIFIRATFGTSMVDPKFATYRAAARAKPVPYRAYYHFLVANVSAQTQFDYFESVVGDLTAGENVMLDDETYSGTGGLPSRALVEQIATLCQQRWGLWPIHYSLTSTGRVLSCPQTNAAYTTENVGGDFQQYTDGTTGGTPRSAAGIGACDMNRCNGTLASYFIGATPTPAPDPPQPEEDMYIEIAGPGASGAQYHLGEGLRGPITVQESEAWAAIGGKFAPVSPTDFAAIAKAVNSSQAPIIFEDASSGAQYVFTPDAAAWRHIAPEESAALLAAGSTVAALPHSALTFVEGNS